MTDFELYTLIGTIVMLVGVNLMLFLKKKVLLDSKNSWVYFSFIKFSLVGSAIFTGLQLYIFCFGYVAKIGNDMSFLVMYYYIGYLLIVGFIAFMDEMQISLFKFMSILLLAYQCYMCKQLIVNRPTLEIMLDSPYNPFRYGTSCGYLLCAIGPILTLLAALSVWHYWYRVYRHS